VALYNTAFGLVIAIPSMICYRHFRARVDSYLVEMEQQSLRLIDTIRLTLGSAQMPAAQPQPGLAPASAQPPTPAAASPARSSASVASPAAAPARSRGTGTRRAAATAKDTQP